MPISRINFNFIIGVVLLAAAAFVSYALITQAASAEDIVYPVPELGNCQNETACRSYCDQPKNMDACVRFAEKHNLIPDEELKKAKKFIAAGKKGPGGCDSHSSCETYCNDVNHINECLAFAEKNNMMDERELEEAKKVQAALAKGAVLPGGCRNKNECENYCQSAEHVEECMAFAETAGFLPPEEIDNAKKFLAAVKKGVKPPPCSGSRDCDAYCAESEHFEECIVFAEAAGFMSPEEIEIARKTGGKGPGGCRGRECKDFCENESNFEICLNFAAEHGMIKPEEIELARKTGGKGPGGCHGRKECEDFCQNPANQETCFSFAKERGLIKEDDLRRMEEGRQRMAESFQQAPPEVKECLNNALGADFMEKLQSGGAMPSHEVGEKMHQCFEQAFRSGGPDGMGMPRPEGEGEWEKSEDGQPGMHRGFDMPPQIQDCLKAVVGEEVLNNLRSGQASPPPDFNDKMRACFEKMRSGGEFPMPERDGDEGEEHQGDQDRFLKQGICPAMPTVSECPLGQKRVSVFSSPECGTYYSCVPEGAQQLPENTPSPEGFKEMMPSGETMPSPEQMRQMMEQKTQEQIQQQYLQPPEGSYTPPSYTPPPSGTSPENSTPPPSVSVPEKSFLANLLDSFIGLIIVR